MNKKGDLTQGKIIALVIAIFVLVLVSLFAYSFFSGNAIPFFNFIPSFNMTKPVAQPVEIVRYNTADFTVQYYDGTSWKTLGDSVTLGDKVVFDGHIREAVDNFYYKRSDFSSGLGVVDFQKQMDNTYATTFLFMSWGESQVLHSSMRIKVQEETETRIYFVDYVNKLYKWDSKTGELSEIISLSSFQKAFASDAIEWRDSVLKAPHVVNWIAKPGSIGPSGTSPYFCFEKIGTYLRVDLSKPVDAGATCLG